jgi:hypothetical protein
VATPKPHGRLVSHIEYAAWLENLPDSLQDGTTAEALRTICDLDLSELQAIIPPRGFGRDGLSPLGLTPVMHRDLPRPRSAQGQRRCDWRGSLLCMPGIGPNQRLMRGRDWTRKGGRNWKRFDTDPLPFSAAQAVVDAI